MASRQLPRSLQAFGLPALVLAAAYAAGCVLQAPAAVPSSTPTSQANATARPTPEPAVTQPPMALESPAADVVDSDLAPEDNTALESLIDSDQLSAYLPDDLIHDGGVILFRTLAAREKEAERPIAGRSEDDAPPADWRRTEGKRVGRQLELRKDNGEVSINADEKHAKITVRYTVAGALVYRDNGRVARKAFRQAFDRKFKFVFKKNKWQLDQLSPLHHESQGGHSGLELSRFAVYPADGSSAIGEVSGEGKFIKPDDLLVFAPGDKVRLEVAAKKTNGGQLYVYAYLVGGADRARMLLVDDGTQGDRTAGDGVYGGTFVIPSTPGVRTFGVDAIDAASFTAGGVYRSIGDGLSFRVQSK